MDLAPSYSDLLSKIQDQDRSIKDKDSQIGSIKKELSNAENEKTSKSIKRIAKSIAVKDESPTFTLPFGDYNASLINGIWKYEPISKAIEPNKLTTTLKYKDPVQYKVMEQYESESENEYKMQLGKMTIEIVKFLKEL